MLSVREVSEKLGISRQRVFQLIKKGVIPAKKFSGIWIIEEEDLKNLVWKRTPGKSPK